jgi:hypothetical protein
MVFLIDLPRFQESDRLRNESPQFYLDLVYFCKAMGLQEDVIDRLSGFDFSKAKPLAFVHTM